MSFPASLRGELPFPPGLEALGLESLLQRSVNQPKLGVSTAQNHSPSYGINQGDMRFRNSLGPLQQTLSSNTAVFVFRSTGLNSFQTAGLGCSGCWSWSMCCAYPPQLCSLPGICSGDQEMAANILVDIHHVSDKPFWILGIKMELGSLQGDKQEPMGSEKHWLDLRKNFHRRVVQSGTGSGEVGVFRTG